jgi:hypothetical protein
MSDDDQSIENDVDPIEKQKETSNIVNAPNKNLSNFYRDENDDSVLASSTFEAIKDGSYTLRELIEMAGNEFHLNEIEAETKILRLITEWNKIKGLLVRNAGKRKRNDEFDEEGSENQRQTKRRRIDIFSKGKEKDLKANNSGCSSSNSSCSSSSDSSSTDQSGSRNDSNSRESSNCGTIRSSTNNVIEGISSGLNSMSGSSDISNFNNGRLSNKLLNNLVSKAVRTKSDRLDQRGQHQRNVEDGSEVKNKSIIQIDEEDDEMVDQKDRDEMSDDYEMEDNVLEESESMSFGQQLARMVLLRELEGGSKIRELELWDPLASILDREERMKLVREIDSGTTRIPLPGRLEPPTKSRGRQQWARDNLLFKVMNDLRVVLKGLAQSIALVLDGKGEQAVFKSAKVTVLTANALSLLNAERMQIHYPRELVRTIIKPRTEPILREEYRERAKKEAQERRDTGVVMRSFFRQGGRSYKDGSSRDIKRPGRQFRNSFPHFNTISRWKVNKGRFQSNRFQNNRVQNTSIKQQKTQQ